MDASSQVFVNEGTFGILDDGNIPIESVDWSQGLIAPMAGGALILTGINTGNVHVNVRIQHDHDHDQSQSPDDERWEETARARIRAPHGRLHVESLLHGPHEDLPLLSRSGPGWYQVEVRARGRRLNPDGSIPDSSEYYLIAVRADTPAPPAAMEPRERLPVDSKEELRRERLRRGGA
ncbi:hypothetical protein [Streptomyces sp. NPDC091268]|uniref:hypothetical protein n=1 Tax=Streptomyces sp. NPDC091268 TaxID=3365979 RepID=UPI00382575E3